MKWLVLVCLWVAVVLFGGWLRWIALLAALVASYFVVGLWWYRNSKPWRRVYFRAIGIFTPLGSAYVAAADAAGETYDPEATFPQLLRRLYPRWTEEQIAAVLDEYRRKMAGGVYRAEWERHFNEVFSGMAGAERQDLMLKQFTAGESGLRVRSLIGDLIEREAGGTQRAEFWRALFAGHVQ